MGRSDCFFLPVFEPDDHFSWYANLIDIAHIRHHLKQHSPNTLDIEGGKHAAVAMIMRERDDEVEVLFIERMRRREDPWSGQMAFPGGMVEPVDQNSRHAAERETREEVDVHLGDSEYLGRLNDEQGRHSGHRQGIVVSGHAYFVNPALNTRPNYEVQDILWVQLSRFLDPQYFTTVTHPTAPDQIFPGIQVNTEAHQIVWGLTRRFMASFFDAIKTEFNG